MKGELAPRPFASLGVNLPPEKVFPRANSLKSLEMIEIMHQKIEQLIEFL
jgi:hypothetical protein